jgi:ABC-type sulfate transport system permease component
MPLDIYAQFSTDFPAALALSAVLVVLAGAVLLAVKVVFGVASRAPR